MAASIGSVPTKGTFAIVIWEGVVAKFMIKQTPNFWLPHELVIVIICFLLPFLKITQSIKIIMNSDYDQT